MVIVIEALESLRKDGAWREEALASRNSGLGGFEMLKQPTSYTQQVPPSCYPSGISAEGLEGTEMAKNITQPISNSSALEVFSKIAAKPPLKPTVFL
jgi:hypothetical protein